MTTQNGAPAEGAAPTNVQPAAPAAGAAPTTTPAPEQGEPSSVTLSSSAFKDRLARERDAGLKDVMKALGITDVAKGKEALDAYRSHQESQKTELQKALDRVKALEEHEGKSASYLKVIEARATAELTGLTDAQKAAVTAIAGDAPDRVLATIDALRPTWAAASAAAPAPVPPVAAPANTTPPASPPAVPPSPGSGVDHKATYEAMKLRNPLLASAYLLAHQGEIYPTPSQQ